jgi:hypothetical protein
LRRLGLGTRGSPEDVDPKALTAALIVFPLTESLIPDACVRVGAQGLKTGRVAVPGGTVSMTDLRTSLLYHARDQRLTAICAQYVGVRLCYCLLARNATAASGAPEPSSGQDQPAARAARDAALPLDPHDPLERTDYIELVDQRMSGFTPDNLVTALEHSWFCKKPREVKRYAGVWMTYLDGFARKHERLFEGTDALNVQHCSEIQAGLRPCRDDPLDALTELVRGMIVGRGDASGAVLFGDPEARRAASHPPLPPALPHGGEEPPRPWKRFLDPDATIPAGSSDTPLSRRTV